MVKIEELPEMIFLQDYRGDYHSYIDAVYEVFKRDFILHRLTFGSNVLKLKHYPVYQQRAYTFYHMTHHGEKEDERTPDFRRCERMPWARPTVEDTVVLNLKFWEQNRNGKSRVCIWMEVDNGDNYFVILDVRKTFVLIWTAFFAEYPHQVKKKQKEYEEWLNSVGGVVMTPDELITDIQNRLS